MSNLINLFNNINLGEPFIKTQVNLLISLIFTIILVSIMLITYKLSQDPLSYNRKFNITLMMLSFISTVLLSLVQNYPLLSLGVFGSLSICRVRANTKDPRDIGFVFWSLSIGISSAVGEFAVGLMSTLILSMLMVIFSKSIKRKDVLTMVVRGSKDQVTNVQKIFYQIPNSSIQAKNLFTDSFELVYKLKLPPHEGEKLLLALNNMHGINSVNVLAPQTKVA
ncbi:DUF4956 domain-containing protein [Clostridium swellfunianum]|uniref:DUF4956 domain-containing protein n=1 Tax=Clostridium swellfunianum TaxID=1367462 RepID=UPI0020301A62|nr:DUF4956 domain-containing protein [Clostridium swellfunianum]MCM0650517.1 DUF4956 domain-containing protein [Clostridium swellfunianum]